jgi:hypothetical protein
MGLQFSMKQPAMCRFLIENGADIDELAVAEEGAEFTWLELSTFSSPTSVILLTNSARPLQQSATLMRWKILDGKKQLNAGVFCCVQGQIQLLRPPKGAGF